MDLKKRRWQKRTIASDLALKLGGAITAAIVCIGVSYYVYTTGSILRSLTEHAEATTEEIVKILAPNLFAIDDRSVRHMGRVYLATDQLNGIRIVSNVSGTLVDSPASEKSLLPPQRKIIVWDGEEVGTVEIWFSDREVRDVQRRTVLIAVIATFVILLASTLSIGFTVRRVVVRPLERLRTRLAEMAEGSFGGREPSVPQEDLNAILQSVGGIAVEVANSQNRLQESERKYREIFNAAGDAIFIHDAGTGEILDVNETMLQMYGYTRHEAVRLKMADLSSNEPPYTQEGASEKTGQAVEEGQVRFDWQARRRNGELFWVEVFLKRTEIGGENRILAVVRDINERKENERELLREKSFSQAVIDAIPGVFYVYDEMGSLIQWNKKYETISGYSAEELKGKKVWDHFEGEDRERLIRAFQDVFREGEKTIEVETVLKDGRRVPAFFSGRRFETDRGVFQVGIGLDISDRKKVEAELRQAQKMEAIGTLAGGIAHDFNNILSAIIGFTELAKLETGDNAELSSYLKEVEAAGVRASDLVKQILTFSRQRERDKRPLEISLVVREALKLLRSSIPATIEIIQNIPPQRAVLADPTQIHQIVMNLCTNAYHAMQETGGTLGVTLKDIALEEESVLGMEATAGAYIELCVSDTGHGMDSETMTRIFDPYFTSKEPGRGTGLGLSVVHGIVESHRGFIKVYSEPGEGTTFKVYLPVTSREAEERPKREKEPLRGGSERIMLVDDDQKIIDFGREILGRYGYEIESYTNGVQALQSMEENPGRIDLLVTDMTMPYMTGMVLAKKILEIRPDLSIILCTGFSELTSREKAAAIGITGFLEKPVAVDNLIRTVREILDRHLQQSPPEGSAPD